METHMKTTLEIPDHLMRELKERAAREGRTMSELVEAALRTLLDEKRAPAELPPLPTWNGGAPLINIDSRAEWYDQLDDDLGSEKGR
jgi:Arc/MetJ-type ribon-helix-helix transcriptional regulator